MKYNKSYLKANILGLTILCLHLPFQLHASNSDPFKDATIALESAQPSDTNLIEFGKGVIQANKPSSKAAVQGLMAKLFELGKIQFKNGFEAQHIYQAEPTNINSTYFTSDTGQAVNIEQVKEILSRSVKDAKNIHVIWNNSSFVQGTPTITIFCEVNFTIGKQYKDGLDRKAVKIIFDNRNTSTNPKDWFVFDAYPVNANQIPSEAIALN